jgi:hypothetical protein
MMMKRKARCLTATGNWLDHDAMAKRETGSMGKVIKTKREGQSKRKEKESDGE